MTAARLPGLVVAALAAGLLSVVPTATVVACSCAQMSTAEALEFSDVAFVGRVIGAAAPPAKGIVSSGDPVRYAFAVESVHKGQVAGQIEATSASSEASCGTSFAIDERWLVFASTADGTISTGLCSGNVLLTGGAEEADVLALIGPPLEVPEPAVSAAEPAGDGIPVGLVGVVAVAVVLLGVSAWAFLLEPRRRDS